MTLDNLQELLEKNLNLKKDVENCKAEDEVCNMFLQYAFTWCYETKEELEEALTEKFKEFDGMEDKELTDEQKERLEELFIESDLEQAYEFSQEEPPMLIGCDWNDVIDYGTEMLCDYYGASEFIERFYNYIDVESLINDLVRFDDLPAKYFNGAWYYDYNI